jgi:hypothetical protein
MSVIDFLTVAPHLTNAGKILIRLLNRLKNFLTRIQKPVELLRLLCYMFFSKDATLMAGTSVYSIFKARKTEFHTTINHSIVKALHNALINKDNVRYNESR